VPRNGSRANTIGLRREDKNAWERRVALTPDAVRRLHTQGIDVLVERFERRAFSDDAYADAGAKVVDDVRAADVILGIKEIPSPWFHERGAYLFFSHTIKGQWFNMPMLSRMMKLGCTLIDYECVTGDDGRRLIYFSRHAGLVGMIDTLWTLGTRLSRQGIANPFDHMEPAHGYPNLGAAKEAVGRAAERIRAGEVPPEIRPLTIGFTGSGNVTRGALEVFRLLPFENVAPEELETWVEENADRSDMIGAVCFDLRHLAERVDGKAFDKATYYAKPEGHRSRFAPYLSPLNVLVHGIYWDERYPVFASREELATAVDRRLRVIGDITCDVEGSLACTVRDTEPGDPVFVYDPTTGEAPSGFEGPGVAVMAVGNLPTELPLDASEHFSEALEPFVPALAAADLEAPFEQVDLPAPIRRAVIVWRGELTPDYAYLADDLARQGLSVTE